MPTKVKQVRFAYKNDYRSPPPSILAVPMFSHSASTATSSSGPVTPPTPTRVIPGPAPYGIPRAPSSTKYHSLPPPKAPSYVPSYAPSHPKPSSRYSGPPRAHPYLETNGIVWDLVENPSTAMRSKHHLSSRALLEPATEPPMPFIIITCTYLPWQFKVSALNGKYVTIEDMLEALYRSLRVNITQPEFNSFPSERDQRRATRAYEDRYRRLRGSRYDEEKRSGMKRVDFLMGRTRFVGISNNGRRPDEWHLSVT